MNKQQVEKFINKFDLPSKIIVKFLPESEMTPYYPAQVSELEDGSYLLELCRKEFLYHKDEIYLKALLVHELGHIATFHITFQSSSYDEYIAHRWALRVTFKKRFFRIHRELQLMIESWKNFTWNEDGGIYRRYIVAASI